MAGIYIHIPFCRQACHYCNFHFTVNLKNQGVFVNALLNEIRLCKDYLEGEEIETIYFGGGTPSLLHTDELNRIFDELLKHFVIARGAEITLEANPDDLSGTQLRGLRTTPVNRFSIGVQSFHDDDLLVLNRAHSATQAESSIKLSQDAGFENITLDLIYAIPTLTDEKWRLNLRKTADLNILHFSAYCLTVEPKTALEKFIRDGKFQDVDESRGASQFEMLMDFAEQTGYDHYEISNFSKSGFYSRHNSSYWIGKKYLGLGPSAHSFNGVSRQWNISNTTLYTQSLEKGELLFEKENLTETDRFNEYVMTSLRTKRGVDKNYLEKTFGKEKADAVQKNAAAYLNDNFLTSENESIRLTRKGKLIADKIISDLFETS